MPSYEPVAALLRGLDVLRAVNRGAPATVKGIHEETGIDKATVVRMLETLIHAGYVAAETDRAGYRVTGRVLQLSAGFDAHHVAAELCTPILARFRQSVGWPSDFAIRDGTEMIVVRTSRGTGPLAFDRAPGFRAPILLTSIGKAYLAHCAPAELAEVEAGLTAAGGTGEPVRADMLEQVRRDGYAVMDEIYSQREYAGALRAVAVPVLGGGRLFGALNLAFLQQALPVEQAVAQHLPALREAADQLAAAFAQGGLAGTPAHESVNRGARRSRIASSASR